MPFGIVDNCYECPRFQYRPHTSTWCTWSP